MEDAVKGIASEHGLSGLLAGVIILLAVNALIHITKFLFELARKSNELTAEKVENLINAMKENTGAINALKDRLDSTERRLVEGQIDLSRLKTDSKRFFIALRVLSGDDATWEKLVKRMSEHDFVS